MNALPDGRLLNLPIVVDCSADEQCCLDTPTTARARFRLTPSAYRLMLMSQSGVCAICGNGAWRGWSPVPLSIDHDHVCCQSRYRTCGRCVRGLLCAGCNGFLGLLEMGSPNTNDDPAWLTAAAAYLRRHGTDPSDPHRLKIHCTQHLMRMAKAGVKSKCLHGGQHNLADDYTGAGPVG